MWQVGPTSAPLFIHAFTVDGKEIMINVNHIVEVQELQKDTCIVYMREGRNLKLDLKVSRLWEILSGQE